MELPNSGTRAGRAEWRNRFVRLWQSQRVLVLRLLVLFLIGVSVAATISTDVADFVEERQHLSFALVFFVVLLFFEAVLQSDGATAREDRSLVLGHFAELRPYLARAFASGIVELDIASYSSETFYGVLTEFLQGIISGTIRVRRLRIRILVADCSAPMAVPCRIDTCEEHQEYKASLVARNERFANEFQTYINSIRRRMPDADIEFETRMHRLSPVFKFIVINDTEGFFALYPIEETHTRLGTEDVELWDFRGERAHYMSMKANGSAVEREMLESARKWFAAVWSHLAAPAV